MFVHKARHIATRVHGDNSTSAETKVKLDWLESQLDGKYELRKAESRFGPAVDDCNDFLVLNWAIP